MGQKILSDPPSPRDFPFWRKCIILFVVSWMTLSASFSSTCLFPATPAIAGEFNTTASIINITNAGVLLAMGSSSLIWGPIATTIGRRLAYNIAIAVLCVCSIGTALSINMAMFTAMRILAGFEGTYQMVAGQVILTEVFDPKVRGTAVGFFMAGSVLGPALGPLVGGVVISFCSWRVIFWIQTGMVALGLVLSLLFVPSIAQSETPFERAGWVWPKAQLDMFRMFSLLVYPNILLTNISCGLLAWTQYSLLASVRHLINPRFNLTSPLVSGLFYLSPGMGFLIGSICGGKYSDRTMAKSFIKRGERVPQDRLMSGIFAIFFIIPAAGLTYGWCLEYKVGGMAVLIVSAFFIGFGMMVAFSSLNTYCTESLPRERTKVIASKYFVQYIFGASGNATILPLIDSVGSGISWTIAVVLAVVGGCLVLTVAKFGTSMQTYVEVRLHNEKEPESEMETMTPPLPK